MKYKIADCLLSAGIAFVLFPSLCHSQSLPPNLNLVTNGSFEFNICGAPPYNDSTFTNNPTCWVRASKAANPFLCPSALYNFTRPRSGKSAFILAKGFSKMQIATGTWIDTPDIIRSYAETKLLKPLVSGTAYYFTAYFGAKMDTASPTATLSHHQDIVQISGCIFLIICLEIRSIRAG